jgi:hypothetical protein
MRTEIGAQVEPCMPVARVTAGFVATRIRKGHVAVRPSRRRRRDRCRRELRLIQRSRSQQRRDPEPGHPFGVYQVWRGRPSTLDRPACSCADNLAVRPKRRSESPRGEHSAARPKLEPLSAERYLVEFTASAQVYARLKRAKSF